MATWSAEELLLADPEPQEAQTDTVAAEELVAPMPQEGSPPAISVEELVGGGAVAVGRDSYPVGIRALNTGLQGE